MGCGSQGSGRGDRCVPPPTPGLRGALHVPGADRLPECRGSSGEVGRARGGSAWLVPGTPAAVGALGRTEPGCPEHPVRAEEGQSSHPLGTLKMPGAPRAGPGHHR